MRDAVLLQEGRSYLIVDLLPDGHTSEDREALKVSAVRLGSQLRADLGLRRDAFVVEETVQGTVLRTGGVAGTVILGSFTFDICPKHAPDAIDTTWRPTLNAMLDRASRRRVAFAPTRRLNFRPRTFIDQLAMGLALELEAATRRAEVRAYHSERAELAQVRGRILVSEQLRSSLLKPHKVVCEVDELSPDNPVNHLLHWATSQLSALVTHPRVRHELSVQAGRLPTMSTPIRPPTRLSFHLPRQYHHYAGAVELAGAFARGLTTVHGSNATGGAGFLVGTERLFESFVERSLEVALAGQEIWTVDAQKRSEYAVPVDPATGDRSFYSTPDNVVRRIDGSQLIVDAKYKSFHDETIETTPDRPSNGDLYQMAAACMAHRCSRALLLYPRMARKDTIEPWKPRWWRIDVGPEHLLVGAVTVPLHDLAAFDGIGRFDTSLREMLEQALLEPMTADSGMRAAS